MSEAVVGGARPPEERRWFGHPPQLARLFTTELWERFGYYGLRALLALYLAQWFLFDDQAVGGLYGAIISLVYLTPLFGGMIADRVLGSKSSVKLGAILMALGYLGLCFGGTQASQRIVYQERGYPVQVSSGADAACAGQGFSCYALFTLTGKDNAKIQTVVTDAGTYRIKGSDDGSLTLDGADGSVLPARLEKGSYRIEAQRDPLWVSLTFLSLALIIVGNGLFKPNISTMVGALYAPGDPRRDAGFSIFYMGINLGSIGSQFLAPILATAIGWWAGFALVSAGMLVSFALIQFDGGRLKGYGETPPGVSARTRLGIYGVIALGIPVTWLLLNNTLQSFGAVAASDAAGTGILGYILGLPLLGKALMIGFVLAVFGIPLWSWRAGRRDEFEKMLAAILLIIFSVTFWTLFEMAGSALTLFADRSTDRTFIGSYVMPAGQTQIFNPVFIVLLAPLFATLWIKLGKRGREPSIPVKFAIGLVLVGAGYLVLVLGAQFADSQYKVALVWLALLYLLHSVGELCLSPVGLSMVTKLSMARVVGLMMGTWFLAISMAQYIGGIITQATSVQTVGGAVTNPRVALQTYVDTFQTVGLTAVAIGLILLLISPLLKKLMHGVQ